MEFLSLIIASVLSVLSYHLFLYIFRYISIFIHKLFTGQYERPAGLRLLTIASFNTSMAFFVGYTTIVLFNFEPHSYFFIPLFILLWYSTSKYYDFFNEGALHWGLVIGIVLFYLKDYLLLS
jgi:hypothetical protein